VELAPGFHQASPKRRKEDRTIRPQTCSSHLLDILREDPYRNPPPSRNSWAIFSGAYFRRRTNIQHRLVYQVLDGLKTVRLFGSGHIMNRFHGFTLWDLGRLALSIPLSWHINCFCFV